MPEPEVTGIAADNVSEWIVSRRPTTAVPLTFDLIAGGHSNLTYRVTDANGQRLVLRRPPLGHVLATAHDMEREHTIISALGPTDVPVPSVVGLCTDESVNGAPFYVMEYVDGNVIRNTQQAELLTPQQRRTASDSLIDVLALIHSVDVHEVGLSDLAKHDSYLERQLKRWYGQFCASRELAGNLDLREVDEAHALLAAHVPPQQGVAIVHGDYRLDNTMLDSHGHVAAVLDWEICTLGDPLADLGLLCVYWTDPGEPAVMPQASPTSLEGFARSSELIERYAATSSRDLSQIDYYIAFGSWKLTCIIAGVYARYAAGAMGDVSAEQVEGFEHMVKTLATQTMSELERALR